MRAREGDGLRIVARNGIPNSSPAPRMPASGMDLGLTERAQLTGGELGYGTDRRRLRAQGLAAMDDLTGAGSADRRITVVLVDDDPLVRADCG